MDPTTRQLDDVIATAYREAAACHGDLGVTQGIWRQRILSILERCGKNPAHSAAAAFTERLHTQDLYLATCCAEGLDAAWQRFEALHQRYIRELVRCLARNALQAIDVGDGLLVDLFLPDRSGRSRIASYDGRSSLATWLHVIVTHRMANERVRKWNTMERPGDMPDVADRSATGELDATLRAARYSKAVDASMRQACRNLSVRDSQMLLWRYQRGLLLEDIARRLSIHPSTVCRQLEKLQERLRTDVIATLARTYGLPDAAIEECLNDLLENDTGSVSLLRLIADALDRAQAQDGVPTGHLHIA
jgi:RNA polymerase sigma-70 factor